MKKTMKFIYIFLITVLTIAGGIFLSNNAYGENADDIPNKNSDGIYEISTAEHLIWYGKLVNGEILDGEGNVVSEKETRAKLMNDIDCSEIKSWKPFGYYDGIFDGNGKALKNINWKFSEEGGLFRINAGIVKNLRLENGQMEFSSRGGGAFVASQFRDAVISGCVNELSLSSQGDVSGIVKRNSGVVAYCANLGNISAYRGLAGGIIASSSFGGKLLNSYNTGNVQNIGGYSGGLLGDFWGSIVLYNSYNGGEISGNVKGKLIGKARYKENNENVLKNNFYLNAGEGGIVGEDVNDNLPEVAGTGVDKITAASLSEAFIEDEEPNINKGMPILSFQKNGNYPEVEDFDYIQFKEVAEADEHAVKIRLNKKIEYTDLKKKDFKLMMPKEEENEEYEEVNINNLSQEDDTISIEFDSIEYLKETEERNIKFKLEYKKTKKFEGDIALGKSRCWSRYYKKPVKINVGDEEYPEFAGYYKISTAEELSWFSNYVAGKLENEEANPRAKAFLANDIYLNDTKDWTEWNEQTQDVRYWDRSIGYYDPRLYLQNRFTGEFNGNGHSIKGMYCVNNERGVDQCNSFKSQFSMFGYLYKGSVKNLGVEDSYIAAAREYTSIGGIVSYLRGGAVTDCFFTGKIESLNNRENSNPTMAGIVGGGSGRVERCYNSGSIGERGIGKATGIFGKEIYGDPPEKRIYNCYNFGEIGGEDIEYAFGITDFGSKYCYNAGTVKGKKVYEAVDENPSLNYYLSDDSGASTQYGVPLTTEQFKDGTLLEKLGEPFVADSENINRGMPILNWQNKLYTKKKNIYREIDKAIEIEKYNLSRKDIRAYIATKKSAIDDADSIEKLDEIIAEIKEYVKNNFHTDEEIEKRHAGLDEELEEANEQIDSIEQEIAKLKARFAFLGVKGGLLKTGFIYTGKAIRPKLRLVNAEGKKLVEKRDFILSYVNNYRAGTAKVKVTAKGKYLGERSFSFKIVPRKAEIRLLKAMKKALIVKWNRLSEASGYELIYAKNSKFKAGKKIYLRGNKTVSKTLKQLTKSRRYYVKLRSCKITSSGKLCGAWSDARSIKVR